MNTGILITKEMAETFKMLLRENRDNHRLQKITGVDYTMSVNMLGYMFTEMNRLPRVAIWWSLEDIRYRANELSIKLTSEQEMEILNSLPKAHDASLGLSWDNIDEAIRNIGGTL